MQYSKVVGDAVLYLRLADTSAADRYIKAKTCYVYKCNAVCNRKRFQLSKLFRKFGHFANINFVFVR